MVSRLRFYPVGAGTVSSGPNKSLHPLQAEHWLQYERNTFDSHFLLCETIKLPRHTYCIYTPIEHCCTIMHPLYTDLYLYTLKPLFAPSMHNPISKWEMEDMFMKLAVSFEPLYKS